SAWQSSAASPPPVSRRRAGHVARATGASTRAQRATGGMPRATHMDHLERKYVAGATGLQQSCRMTQDKKTRSCSAASGEPAAGSVSVGSSEAAPGEKPWLGTREVDEAALRVRAHEPYAYLVTHVESLLTPLDAALHRGVEDADPRPLRRRAGDDTVELLSDPAAQEAGRSGLAHHPLDLLGAVLVEGAHRGERPQLVATVRNLLPSDRGADEALCDQIRIAPVGRRRVRVLADGETEVPDDGLAGEARDVLAASHQLDD